MNMKPDSAAFEIQDRTYDAFTEWGHDLDWREFTEQLPFATINQFAKANRAIVASHGIAKMLVEDARGRRQAAEDDRVVYTGMSDAQLEVLELALIELGSVAQGCMEAIRCTEPTRLVRGSTSK
jgi:hypothetical protein